MKTKKVASTMWKTMKKIKNKIMKKKSMEQTDQNNKAPVDEEDSRCNCPIVINKSDQILSEICYVMENYM